VKTAVTVRRLRAGARDNVSAIVVCAGDPGMLDKILVNPSLMP
jgi:hypothetical protein